MAGEPAADVAEQLEALRQEARACKACPLWQSGTQTVFGDGPVGASLVFVGEAPGRNEDVEGRPFVGASGRLFDEALARAGVNREHVYVTNTVKHRPWEQVGGRERNRQPKASEIKACAPLWLERELALIRPPLVVCLGSVAAKWLLGKDFKLMQSRGRWLPLPAGGSLPAGGEVLASVHPSFVLIQPAESRQQWRETFFADIASAAERLRALAGQARTPATNAA